MRLKVVQDTILPGQMTDQIHHVYPIGSELVLDQSILKQQILHQIQKLVDCQILNHVDVRVVDQVDTQVRSPVMWQAYQKEGCWTNRVIEKIGSETIDKIYKELNSGPLIHVRGLS